MVERDNVIRASFVSIQLIPGLVCVSHKHLHKAMKGFQTPKG